MCIICMGIAKLLSLTICSCLSTSSDVSKHCKCLPDYFRTQSQNLAQLSQTRRIRDWERRGGGVCDQSTIKHSNILWKSGVTQKCVISYHSDQKHRKQTRGSDRENEKESLFIDSAKHMLKNQSTRSARERESGREMLFLWCVRPDWYHCTGSHSLPLFVLISLWGCKQARLDPQNLLSGQIRCAHIK